MEPSGLDFLILKFVWLESLKSSCLHFIDWLLFVHRQDVPVGHRVDLIQLEGRFVQITSFAAQEIVYTSRTHHVRQHDRWLTRVVQVAHYVLIVHVYLQIHLDTYYVHCVVMSYLGVILAVCGWLFRLGGYSIRSREKRGYFLKYFV